MAGPNPEGQPNSKTQKDKQETQNTWGKNPSKQGWRGTTPFPPSQSLKWYIPSYISACFTCRAAFSESMYFFLCLQQYLFNIIQWQIGFLLFQRFLLNDLQILIFIYLFILVWNSLPIQIMVSWVLQLK